MKSSCLLRDMESSGFCFIFLFVCFLISLHSIRQIVATIMAITGIVMMAYADNFHADSIIGVAFAVGSASTSALYKVCHALSYAVNCRL